MYVYRYSTVEPVQPQWNIQSMLRWDVQANTAMQDANVNRIKIA